MVWLLEYPSANTLSALDPGKQGLKLFHPSWLWGFLSFQRLIQENKD